MELFVYSRPAIERLQATRGDALLHFRHFGDPDGTDETEEERPRSTLTLRRSNMDMNMNMNPHEDPSGNESYGLCGSREGAA